jgi:hypothetical protein
MRERIQALVARIHRAYPEFNFRESDERARKAFEAL